MATFMERLRAPGLRGNGLDGSETAGESDLLSKMASQALLERQLNMGGGAPIRQPNLAMRSAPQRMPVNTMGRAVDPNKGPMNVVYDQGPEQFNKNLALREKQVDAQADYNKALAGLKSGELDVKRQNADTNRAKAEAIMARQDLTDSEKQLMIMRQALGIEEMRGESRENVAGMQTRSREKVAADDRTSRESEGEANRKNRLDVTDRTINGRASQQDDQQQFTNNLPNNQRIASNNRARQIAGRDPEGATGLSFNPQGDWMFTPNASEEFKARFMAQMQGPSSNPPAQVPGLGSPGLGGGSNVPPPQGSVIPPSVTNGTASTRFTANGKNYNIPADQVAAFLKLNPNAQKVQ